MSAENEVPDFEGLAEGLMVRKLLDQDHGYMRKVYLSLREAATLQSALSAANAERRGAEEAAEAALGVANRIKDKYDTAKRELEEARACEDKRMSKSQLARLSAQVPEIKALQERVVELEREKAELRNALIYWMPDETRIPRGHEQIWNDHMVLLTTLSLEQSNER